MPNMANPPYVPRSHVSVFSPVPSSLKSALASTSKPSPASAGRWTPASGSASPDISRKCSATRSASSRVALASALKLCDAAHATLRYSQGSNSAQVFAGSPASTAPSASRRISRNCLRWSWSASELRSAMASFNVVTHPAASVRMRVTRSFVSSRSRSTARRVLGRRQRIALRAERPVELIDHEQHVLRRRLHGELGRTPHDLVEQVVDERREAGLGVELGVPLLDCDAVHHRGDRNDVHAQRAASRRSRSTSRIRCHSG